MNYWKGYKQTQLEQASTSYYLKEGDYSKPGPSRKLDLEQEFFLVMMRLRLGILGQHLAHRFRISNGLVSQIFTSWIKFLCKKLKWLIMWPSKLDIRHNLLECFTKWYPKIRTIIVIILNSTHFIIHTVIYCTYKKVYFIDIMYNPSFINCLLPSTE